MRKLKYLIPIWIIILSLLIQSTMVFAAVEQEMKNTAPVANFTIEKNREVKLLILTDYTGADNANLKNSINSMKSELANYAKLNIEYANTVDKAIGTQKGYFKEVYWAKNGYATYRWSGYTNNVQYGNAKWKDYYNEPQTDTFVYSNYLTLPEGVTPTTPYGVPIRYTKSALQTQTYQFGERKYNTYTFVNSNGICDGTFNIDQQSYFSYPNGAIQELYKMLDSGPTFKYDDFWSEQGSNDIEVTNTVTGWDLSSLNYEVKENTDTFVIFALDNEDTNYYTPHLASNYRLGQLRSDSNLGKYVKDSDARVYSICSDTLENTNLSVNPKYPITFKGAAQNISLRDLIDSSFDGRSVGQKNITGLVNKIKENVKRPSAMVDMVVATDDDISSTNNFVNNIKDNISSDVDFQTNIVNTDSMETTDTWRKYVTKGDYKNIAADGFIDADIILLGNGELWARGSNAITSDYENPTLGLFGLSTTIKYYDKFVRIATDVKNAYTFSYMANSIYVIKNDGTLMVCGGYSLRLNNRTGYSEPIIYQSFTSIGFGKVRSLAFRCTDTWQMYVVSDSGVWRCDMSWDWAVAPPQKDPYAPANTQYVFGDGYSDSTLLYYISSDGNIDYTYFRYNEQKGGLNHQGKLPYPVKTLAKNTIYLCTDDKYYNIYGECLSDRYNFKQIVIGATFYGLTYDGKIYTYSGRMWGTTGVPVASKILFISNMSGYDGMIVRTLTGEIGYLGRLSYENIFKTDVTSTYEPSRYYASSNGGSPTVFDATVGDTVADYLQIGNRFCYVTKQGNINFVKGEFVGVDDFGMYNYKYTTVNCGSVDGLFDISDKPVKAFSKSKLFNTPLREGSERYFIYISDNVQKDTYFGEPTDYFPFTHLDYSVLNYLNANRFNIYIVTPAQARELKLQYPYVPVARQQLSLKELIYNSVMDSAFCKDKNSLSKLIIKKYDTFTKQGSTTLTLLVNEESVRYNQVYRDFENDPKHSEKWQYSHDPAYFDNSNGLDTNSGQWITDPLYTFSKVGKYIVSAQFRDNPKDDNRFDNYRLWSNKSAPATIIVHRRPIAQFTVSSRYNETTKLCTLRANNTSYDLDHQFSRSDKGIAQSNFEYKLSTDSTWTLGLPTNVPADKTYNMRLKVRDIEGAWSTYYYQDFTTVPINSNEPPEVTITKSLSYVYEGDDLDIIMKPTDPDNDNLNLVLEEKKDSGTWKTVLTKNACSSGSTQTYHITKIKAGDYQYKVTVTDPDGETGSDSLSFTAYPLGITGFVDHTPIWKTNWINYNKHLQSIGKTTYGNDTFFTGEKYILSAITTKISPESSITASNVSVKIIERTYSPVWLTKQSSNTHTGEMWNEDMRGTRWRGTTATFLFTVTYSNGSVKTDSVTTYIIDDDYFRVKMSF